MDIYWLFFFMVCSLVFYIGEWVFCMGLGGYDVDRVFYGVVCDVCVV